MKQFKQFLKPWHITISIIITCYGIIIITHKSITTSTGGRTVRQLHVEYDWHSDSVSESVRVTGQVTDTATSPGPGPGCPAGSDSVEENIDIKIIQTRSSLEI